MPDRTSELVEEYLSHNRLHYERKNDETVGVILALLVGTLKELEKRVLALEIENKRLTGTR